MQHLRAALFMLATFSMVFMVAEPAMAQESQFVFVSRADSPGNDYTRIKAMGMANEDSDANVAAPHHANCCRPHHANEGKPLRRCT